MNKSTTSIVTAALFVTIGMRGPLSNHMAVGLPRTTESSAKANVISLDALQPAPATAQSVIQAVVGQPGPDCHQVACVALTFDDGPNPLTTPTVFNELQAANAKATFFVVGSRVAPNAQLLKQMHKAGMEIANHSWSHPNFNTLNPDQIHQQIDQTQQAITGIGLPAPQYFRPPYEATNAQVLATVHMPFVLWNVDPKDWSVTDPAQLIATIDAQVKPGSIIILHDIWNSTTKALPQILDHLKTKYQFVTVSQLLNLSPGSSGVYSHQP